MPIRVDLRRRGIGAVIAEPADQTANRQRRGSCCARPPGFNAADYYCRNVIERGFSALKKWRGLAARYDKLALTYRAAVVLHAVITPAAPQLGPLVGSAKQRLWPGR